MHTPVPKSHEEADSLLSHLVCSPPTPSITGMSIPQEAPTAQDTLVLPCLQLAPQCLGSHYKPRVGPALRFL